MIACPNCEHSTTVHHEDGCQACDCYYSQTMIVLRLAELKEASRLIKRECWIVTFNLTEHLFTGQARIHFLHEPTREEVLETFLDGEPESVAPKRAVERVKAGDYVVTKGHVMERPL